MSELSVLERVIGVFKDVTDKSEITENSNLMDDLSLTSVETFTVLAALETEFKISIPEKYLRRMMTISDVVNIVTEIMNDISEN